MKPFPLVLREVLFTSMHVEAIPGHDRNTFVPGLIPVENQLKVDKVESQDSEDSFEYMVSMKVVHNLEKDPRSPYSFNFECLAFIGDESKGSDPSVQKGIYISGHSVVYGAIRESLLWLSSRLVYGPFSLGFSLLTPTPGEPTETTTGKMAKSTPPDSPASPSS